MIDYKIIIAPLVGVAVAAVVLVGCNARTTTRTPTPTESQQFSTTLSPQATETRPPTPLPLVKVEATVTPSLATPTPHPPVLTPTPTPSPSPESTPTAPPQPTPTPTLLPTPTPTPTTPPPTPTSVPIIQLPDIAGVVEKVRPTVVSVVTEVLLRDIFGRVFRDTQSGSGVIFDSRGYILTNNHVVDNFSSVTVTLDDGTQFEAEVVGADSLTDLAVLKINGGPFPAVTAGDPSKVRAGDWVIAIGNALALPGGPTVTVGVISALDRVFQVSSNLQLYGLVQTDASINPGNSGGPLLNLRGELVGINTAVARGDQQGRDVEGIGFAVGMDTAVPVAQQLLDQGQVRWAWLGVGLADLTPERAAQVGVQIREGVLITNLLQGGPAWEGGIRAGDVIVSMGGDKVSTVRDLIRILRQESAVGETVEVNIFRAFRERTLKVTLGERPPG